ncbi:hypothetical protein BH747_04090 [Enterococcus villorum]|uniref:Uncharacterized protein n=1 Tax=Enterococcus villorum TaxID=112904 RepID=A0A1V8YFU7_9ENTE|nr:hypothetical protein [Enterococcus villorum]OQO71176.1 hypothetical protein BH747_04090 [Enterococcus villorum]OQO74994.1 hypothetical protein BH744_06320 [Enterococcus villorum]
MKNKTEELIKEIREQSESIKAQLTVKSLLDEMDVILMDIATLEDKDYPCALNGKETTETALERAKNAAEYLSSVTLYDLYELLGIEPDQEGTSTED